jgi:hypothetical protein
MKRTVIYLFQGQPTILDFTRRNRGNPGNVSARSVSISAEIQTEYLPIQVRRLLLEYFLSDGQALRTV